MNDAREFILLTRKRMNMTQEEFAEVLGCSVRTVKRWESGETEPNCTATLAVIRLCGKKNIGIGDLLFLFGDRTVLGWKNLCIYNHSDELRYGGIFLWKMNS